MIMAQARKDSFDITVKHEGVILELTNEEAQFLRDLMCHVGGTPSGSRRKHADVIGKALDLAGVNSLDWAITQREIRGSVIFADKGSF